MSALHGFQPELDRNLSLYEAIRYDDERKPISEVILPTNFPGLDIIPANLELQEYEYDTPLAMQDRVSREGRQFFTRIASALEEVDGRYDVVVVDCPPQLGYLTLDGHVGCDISTHHRASADARPHVDVAIPADAWRYPQDCQTGRSTCQLDWFRYLITRYEPTDIPQAQMVGFMQSMLAEEILTNPMLKSTAVSDAGLTKQTLYEVEKNSFHAHNL